MLLPRPPAVQSKTNPYSRHLLSVSIDDDRQAARTLNHRGFDNVFVLSGGLVAFARSFYSFIEGDVAALRPMVVSDGSNSSGGGGARSTAGTSRGRRSSVSGSATNGGGASSMNGGGSSSSVRGSGSVNGGRLDYRGKGGESVIVRGGFSESSLSGSAAMRSREARGDGAGRSSTTTSSVRGPRSAPSAESFPGGLNAFDAKGRGTPDGPLRGLGAKGGVFAANAGMAGSGGGLGEAVAAASAARRRTIEGRRGGEEDASRASVVTVADSVISRATARRGRW